MYIVYTLNKHVHDTHEKKSHKKIIDTQTTIGNNLM